MNAPLPTHVRRALESAGMTASDRDRSQGLYYIDNRQAQGFWAKLWGEGAKDSPAQYQIRLNETTGQVQVTVEQDGSPAPADTARRVLSLIQQNL